MSNELPHLVPKSHTHGGEGPSSKFLGLLWSSTDPATFYVPPVFAIPPITRSRRFFRVSPLFLRSRPLSEFQGFPPPIVEVAPAFRGPANFSRSGCHPRSVRHPRSVCHLTPGLSVTRPPVCPSPAFGLSVTRLWSVRHPSSVCITSR